jgi:prephenate dehydrogenase
LRIGIVGAAGAMGELLTRYFKREGHSISIYDSNRNRLKVLSKSAKVSSATNLTQLVSKSDVLVVSVPIEETIGIVEAILDSGGKGKCIVEVSSVKKRIVQKMQKYARGSTQIVSIHPLFGPGAGSPDGQRIALIPVGNRSEEERIAMELFPASNLVIIDADLHDRIVALTITGTFLMNMAWITEAAEFSLEDVKRISGPASKLQSLIAESYLAQDLELYRSIYRNNGYSSAAARQLAKGINAIAEEVNAGKRMKKLSSLGALSSRRAYAELYDLVWSLKI